MLIEHNIENFCWVPGNPVTCKLIINLVADRQHIEPIGISSSFRNISKISIEIYIDEIDFVDFTIVSYFCTKCNIVCRRQISPKKASNNLDTTIFNEISTSLI